MPEQIVTKCPTGCRSFKIFELALALKLCQLQFSGQVSALGHGGIKFCPKQCRRYSTSEENSDYGRGPGPGPGRSSDEHYEDNIRNQILEASLSFVPKYGWTKIAISQGAETLGYPGVSHGMFPEGGVDLINYFYVTCNTELTEHMKNITADATQKVVPRVFIEEAIQRRLRMIIPYIDKWPQALGIMTLPRNVPFALANLLTLVDDMCYYAGDKSVDFNWYTRRIGVCGIYKMTELCMVQDKSHDYQETWKFLNRRMDEAMQIHQVMMHTEGFTNVAQEAMVATFTTARNILRLNRSR